MTFMTWIRATAPGAIIYKYGNGVVPCWSVHLDPGGLINYYTTETGGIQVTNRVDLRLPDAVKDKEGITPFLGMPEWRHVAMVFDSAANSIRGYVAVTRPFTWPLQSRYNAPPTRSAGTRPMYVT